MLSIAETKLKNAAVLTFQLPPLPHYTPQTHTHNTQKHTLPFSLSLSHTYPSCLSFYRHTHRHRLLLLVRLSSIIIRRKISIFFPFLCLFVCLFLFGFTKFSLSLPFFYSLYLFQAGNKPQIATFFYIFHFQHFPHFVLGFFLGGKKN